MGPSARTSARWRWAWTVRLVGLEIRRRRGRALVTLFSFVVLTLALATALVCFRAWRGSAGDRPAGLTDGTRVEAQLIALLRDDLPVSTRDALAATLRRLPGVAGVRLLESEQVLARMREELGDRSSVLDGVEEGFLPGTMEIALEPGDRGVGHADAIAARLRRMEGIADVDVLRSAIDGRLARLTTSGRRLAEMGMTLGCLSALLAVGLAGVSVRRQEGDGRLLVGLGFTPAAIAMPAAVIGAACAVAGGLLGIGLTAVALRLGAGAWLGELVWSSSLGGAEWWKGAGVGLVALATVGGGLGWWASATTACDGEALVLAG